MFLRRLSWSDDAILCGSAHPFQICHGHQPRLRRAASRRLGPKKGHPARGHGRRYPSRLARGTAGGPDAPSIKRAEKPARYTTSFSCRALRRRTRCRSGWSGSAISGRTGGPYWGWTAATCWSLRWRPAPRPSSFRPISGRRISPSLAHFPVLTPSRSAFPILRATSMRWKRACPPTRR